MTARTKEKLTRVAKLIQFKRFREALQELKSIDTSKLSRREYGQYCVYFTEASLDAGECCTRFIDDAIEIFRFDADSEMFAKAKYLKGWVLISQGDYREAKEVILEAYTSYKRCKKLRQAALALNRLAFVSVHTGSFESASRNLEMCIEIYQ
jgi:tetratricopeptide (TPR) repeat protein